MLSGWEQGWLVLFLSLGPALQVATLFWGLAAVWGHEGLWGAGEGLGWCCRGV